MLSQFNMGMSATVQFAVVLSFSATVFAASATAQDVSGHWKGAAVRQGASLSLDVSFRRVDQAIDGVITIRTMGAYRLPLKNVVQSGRNLRFELTSDDGTFAFNGAIRGSEINGTWSLFGLDSQVTMQRASDERLPYRTDDVTCHNGTLMLAGTLWTPSSRGTPYPAVIFVHGSGAGPRQVFNFWADQFARKGIAALVFDKRGSGSSTGNWPDADFSDLASDVLACMDVLKARMDIDTKRIGLFGQSQGGWVAPLAASRSRDVSWLVLVSGTPVTPARQNWWEAESRLRAHRILDAEIARARSLWDLNDEVTRTGEHVAELQAAISNVRETAWFEALQFPPTVPSANAPVRLFLRRILDFEALPGLRTLSAPSLWIYGSEDATVPAAESASLLEQLRSEGRPITVRTFSNATHALWTAPTDRPFRWMGLAPGYVDAVNKWVAQQLATIH